MTSGISSMAATSTPCKGPAPPNATSENLRGSIPFWMVRERIALAMLLLTIVRTPSAASRRSRRRRSARSPTARRAASAARFISPPRHPAGPAPPRARVAAGRTAPRPPPAGHPRCRSGQKREHRLVGHHSRRRHAAIGRHDVEFGGQSGIVQSLAEPAHVVLHARADERVHGRRREALEFPELRGDSRRRGHEGVRVLLENELASAFLVTGIEVGEKETHGNGLDAFSLEHARRSTHAFLVQRDQDVAPGRHNTLAHSFAVAPADERPVLPGQLLHDGVVFGPLVTPDMDDVTVASRRDQPGAGATILEHGIGGDGRAVEHVADLRRRDTVPLAELADPAEDTRRGIGRRRGNLVNERRVALGIREHKVGKRPADIDAHELHDNALRAVTSAATIVASEKPVVRVPKAWRAGEVGFGVNPEGSSGRALNIPDVGSVPEKARSLIALTSAASTPPPLGRNQALLPTGARDRRPSSLAVEQVGCHNPRQEKSIGYQSRAADGWLPPARSMGITSGGR